MPASQGILVPGAVTPAELAYGALVAELGADVDARYKDLEVYADDAPPPDYGLDTEVAGILRFADESGFESFHLLGYSGGGAAALLLATRQPSRLRSLALIEPAWAGWQDLTPGELAVWAGFREIAGMEDDEQMMRAFVRLELAPGVTPPAGPPGPPPAWMATRPAGVRAIIRSFEATDLDLEALRRFDRPVWFALGGLSHPDLYAPMRDRLAGLFPDFTSEVYAERHHFDPPHRVEPARVATALRALWARAEAIPGRS